MKNESNFSFPHLTQIPNTSKNTKTMFRDKVVELYIFYARPRFSEILASFPSNAEVQK